MAKNKATQTTAAERTQPKTTAAEIIDGLAAVDQQRLAALQQMQSALETRLRALEREATEAADNKAPDADEKAARLAHFDRLAQGITELRTIEERRPTADPDAFIIHGYVTASKSTVKTLKLFVTDPKGKALSDLAPITADDQGFFTLTLRAADYPDIAKEKTDLQIRIVDEGGKEVFAPSSTVKFEPGRISLFAVAVE